MYLSFAFLSLLFFSGALSEFNIEEDDHEEDPIDFATVSLRSHWLSLQKKNNKQTKIVLQAQDITVKF